MRFEGRIISDILRLSGKTCEYRYIRTKRELMWALNLFVESGFRYLHLSCHGNPTTMFTTLDALSFSELGILLRPALEKKQRLFVSACSMTNTDLADAIMPSTGCQSIVGPRKNIEFGDAALLWASFYHLMFKRNGEAMNRSDIIEVVESISTTFKVQLRYYSRDSSEPNGYSIRAARPRSTRPMNASSAKNLVRFGGKPLPKRIIKK